MKSMSRLLMGTLGISLAVNMGAQNVVVLESFEENIGAVSLMDWGGRPAAGGVVLEHYTRSGAEDPRVTEGEKALKVNLSAIVGWSADFRITLSEEAAEQVRTAAASTDKARYILRWDFTFPASTEYPPAWMSSQVQGFGGYSDQLDSNNGTRTMSISLDVLDPPLPESGPIEIILAQNFGFNAGSDAELIYSLEGMDVYLDNVRLVDTYAPGATAQVYVLQSFEDNDDPLGGAANFIGWGGGTRTSYERFWDPFGAEVYQVSHGTYALQVNYAGPGGWGSDFTIPFAGTKLDEVLKLDLPAEERPARAELARYTLRWDVAYPEVGFDWSGNWLNTSYHTQADGLPWSQAAVFGARRTYSITLDQVNWADWTDPKPSLMFIANGAWGVSGAQIWFDNFRLIDTGEGIEVPLPTIQTFSYDPQTRQISITWSSVAGANYAIDSTAELGSWPTVVAPSVAGQAGTTTHTTVVAESARSFFRVRMLQ
jgi:hypothetical protein